MKYLIIWAILFYQRVAPTSIRKRCIFKKSCSNYVLEGVREKGVYEAFKRFRSRVRACRPGYTQIDTSMTVHHDLVLLRLVDGTIVPEVELSDRLRREFGLNNGQGD
ncbi:membrane protein insertion efficiency factor YidD [Pseudophaeobacter sp. 1A09344]|uniref:membrane protein insertion efficiency factor YidD n=1 Tax=Pseudophaeobacter sp. 1A09344 TaxID=3098144 RepID=UPI0034D4EF88